jgi:hypothetical protein
VKTRRTKEPRISKAPHFKITPLPRQKPVFEQPVLQLPLPSDYPEFRRDDTRKKEEETQRGVWTIDI